MELVHLIFWVVVIGIVIAKVMPVVKRYQHEQQMKEMRRNDPQGWMQQQIIELEERRMAHERQMAEERKKAQKRAEIEKGIEIGKKVFEWWWGKK
jgi:hypothetical protein